MNETTEYTFLGLRMENISIIYGVFLILWGTGVSYLSSSDSITSYIPSMFGAVSYTHLTLPTTHYV